MSEEFEVVARPRTLAIRTHPDRTALRSALIETTTSGGALRVALNGEEYLKVYRRLAYQMIRSGYRLRVQRDADPNYFYAWAVKARAADE